MARGSARPRPSSDGKRTAYRAKWETRSLDGKRKHHSKTFRTKKEADAFLIEKQKEVNDGAYVDPSKETLGAYLERWLQAMAPTWTESTLHQYREIVRCRLVPELGPIPLASLDPITVQSYYSALRERYAPGTVRQTHAILDNALSRAVKWRLIARNPADDVTLPTIPPPASTVWTATESAAFLKATTKHRFSALWRLALDSGMRIGEILGLAWRDVDLDAAAISVRRTLTIDADGNLKLSDTPKTKASRRLIVIGPATVTALRTYRANQAKRRLLLGPGWHNNNLVFDCGDGRPMQSQTVRKSFDRAVARTPALPRITLHGLRHTMATILLAAGVNPKIVQERLGHASIQMTLDRYSHVSATMQADAARILDTLLAGDARPERGQDAS